MITYVKWFARNSLFVITLILLAFIPLYPKLPLIDIKNTWVSIRFEDFFIAVALGILFVHLVRKKVSIKTPLTIPIILFWVIGGLSTILGIIFIFPHIPNVFTNVAILSYIRRIEYLSVFFIAYAAMRDKTLVKPFIIVLTITLFCVIGYGLGQRGILVGWDNRFPAFSTMNEEFAKGTPLLISATNRIQSTFAGHYDLAAYLLLLIPIMGSFVLGYRNWIIKGIFFLAAVGGLVLLLMTESRVSFAVYIIAITLMLFMHKKKILIIPVILGSILLLNSFQGISERYASTFSQVDLVVDAKTGKPIGIAKNITEEDGQKKIIIEDKQSTGENLPQGSKYINVQGEGQNFESEIEYRRSSTGGQGDVVTSSTGQVIVKKAFAYDVSFTTRFQGEWPRAIEAFRRNILLGSGYSSINLATDNNYLRILGEVGLLGLLSFFSIFFILGITLWRTFPHIQDRVVRSLIIGFVAGLSGLALNAILIDVFEASKVAFVLWTIIGAILGLAKLYQKDDINYFAETKRILLSVPAVILYLLIATMLLFAKSFGNYFVGDDFTWFRWAADCQKAFGEYAQTACVSFKDTLFSYFTYSEGFFYRPGTKVYFHIMYPIFELFPTMYHVISVLLHFVSGALVFLISLKLLKSKVFAIITAVFFLVISAHGESIYWISVTGHMIASAGILMGLYLYMLWKEQRKVIFFLLALASTTSAIFFHEFGVVAPLLLIAYDVIFHSPFNTKTLENKWYYLILLLPIPLYYVLRMVSHSVWFHGDYSYNVLNLPFNVLGNLVGYTSLTLFGNAVLPTYSALRAFGSANPIFVAVLGVVLTLILLFMYRFFRIQIKQDARLVIFSVLFFIIALLPFLGLGNISPRYVYLPSAGIVLLFVLLLRRTFRSLLTINKGYGYAFLVLVATLFSFFHIKDLAAQNEDWKKAGEISNDMLVELNYSLVQAADAPTQPLLYFVNTPIRFGEAWVFPVGLPDALWFTLRNTDVESHLMPNLPVALDAAEATTSARVFLFEDDGRVVQVIRNKPLLSP